MTVKKNKKNTGIALAEYVCLLMVVVATIVAKSEFLGRAIKGKIVNMSDNYIGTEQETRDLPYNLSGGKQFVDQGGVFNFSGDTTTNTMTQVSQDEAADGSRNLQVREDEFRRSPGVDGLKMKALPDYRFNEVERKAYLPKFVAAGVGYVEPPAMGGGGGTGGGGTGE